MVSKKIIAVLGVAVSLAACVTESGPPLPRIVTDQFENGVSTYDQVIAVLGAPSDSIELPSHLTQIEYTQKVEEQDALTFVPFFGHVLGSTYTDATVASFTFTPAGLLVDHQRSETHLVQPDPFFNIDAQ